MLLNKRADALLKRVSQSYDPSRAPEGVLLYSPTLLRIVALAIYSIYLAGFINNFFVSDFFNKWFSNQQETRLFYGQLALVIVGAIGTGGVVVFARRRYRGAMLLGTFLGIGSGMIASAYMFGLDVNPHTLTVLVPLLLVGFAVGRNGLLLSAAWIIVMYAFLGWADNWGWWPRPTSISIEVVKHENVSAFMIMLAILLATQLYLVKLGVALRKQGQLYNDLQAKERHQAYLLARVMTAQEDERKRIARDLHDTPLQELFTLGRTLGRVRQEMQDMLASCEDALLELSQRPNLSSARAPGGATTRQNSNSQDHQIVIDLLSAWQNQLERLLGEGSMPSLVANSSPNTLSVQPGDHTQTTIQDVHPTLQGLIVQVKAVTEQMRQICSGLYPTYLDDPLVPYQLNSNGI